jgi:uncharacterized protein DUF3866
MPSFSTGVVTAVRSEREGLQRVEVGGEPAYVLTALVGPVAVGDRVVVNTTAVDLGLGTGGWHVVHWNLARDSWTGAGGGTVMKLRYTSLQADVGAAEEAPGYRPPADLDGIPVIACALHSQVACVAVVLAEAPGRRVVYLMTDSAALPLAFSDLVADLRAEGLLASTVTCGQAFGGDHEAVSLASGLEVARTVGGADVIVVGPGPGVVGTGSRLGFSGIEVAAAIDAVSTLGGRPVVAVRFSGSDARERHRGVSQHTVVSLEVTSHPALVAVPRGERAATALIEDRHPVAEVDVPDVAGLCARHGLEVTTMGRGPADDPAFFRWAGAAGVAAAQLLGP